MSLLLLLSLYCVKMTLHVANIVVSYIVMITMAARASYWSVAAQLHVYLTPVILTRLDRAIAHIPRSLALQAVARFDHFHFTGPLDDTWTRY
jgi:hypothetical protein